MSELEGCDLKGNQVIYKNWCVGNVKLSYRLLIFATTYLVLFPLLMFEVCLLSICIMIFYLVSCELLTNPDNGLVNCRFGDDRIPSYEDICSFTCNTGYELTSSDTRTCQSDGSWSGSDTVCRIGKVN